MKRWAITVQGDRHEWSFEVRGTDSHVEDWRADGLQVDEVVNSIPAWVVDLGLLRAWCFVEDLLWFRRPW